jgi:hypothetical protein
METVEQQLEVEKQNGIQFNWLNRVLWPRAHSAGRDPATPKLKNNTVAPLSFL